MNACATYEDVNLVLKLYELRREQKLREARSWFVKVFQAKTMAEFDKICPRGTDENAHYRMVISYWDMVASFVTSGVLHQELFFQNGRELLVVWERIRDLLPEFRKTVQDPTSLENLEKVAKAYIDWMNKRAPHSYEAFAARIRDAT